MGVIASIMHLFFPVGAGAPVTQGFGPTSYVLALHAVAGRRTRDL